MTIGTTACTLGAIGYERTHTASIKNRSALALKLLATASAGVMSISLAQAQAVPPECTPATAVAGGTIVCVAAAPDEVGPIETNVDDLTIVVGDAVTPTTVRNTTGTAIDSIIGVSGTGDLVIDTTYGNIIGDDNGIYAINYGSGSITVNSADVTGTNGVGINTQNGEVLITSQKSAVARGQAGENITINATGDVTGASAGISAFNTSATGDITINAVNVTATGAPETDLLPSGIGVTGILAQNLSRSGTGDVSITATGDVAGGNFGISAINNSSGGLNIVANNVSSSGAERFDAAINARSSSESGAFITSTGDIVGTNRGIRAVEFAGDLTIVTNNVTGIYGSAIVASTGQVTSSSGAYQSVSSGKNISITTNGTVTGGNNGITAGGIGPDLDSISINAIGDVNAQNYGISVRNEGLGDIDIKAVNVTAANAVGIIAFGEGASTNISVTATGDVSGGTGGIAATNIGAGNINIAANNVTNGISAIGRDANKNITITSAGSVTAEGAAIRALKYGTGEGSISISANNATSTSGYTIEAMGMDTTKDITINSTGTVTGGYGGIQALNYGTGGTSISVNNVSGTDGTGIFARNGSVMTPSYPVPTSPTDLIITATGDVSGGLSGINAQQFGAGKLSVTANNVVSASDDTGTAAILTNNFSGSGTEITATGDITGGADGIRATNGSGDLNITANNVTGENGSGILALSRQFTYNGAVTFARSGENISITTTGNVTGTQFGIGAFGSGTDFVGITIDAQGPVTGTLQGIRASNNGIGDVSVDAVDVTGVDSVGISVSNRGRDLSITSTGTVSGAFAAIGAFNRGNGATNVTANNVTGTNNLGITALNLGTDLSVTANGDVTGQSAGISAVNMGTGALTITAANVAGGANNFTLPDSTEMVQAAGIFARNTGTSVNVTASGDVSSEQDGIVAQNMGSGDTVIAANNVSGANGAAIKAINADTAGDLSIAAAGEVSGKLGIYALALGNADISITSTGTISTGDTAIAAEIVGDGDISVNANIINSDRRGLILAQRGAGNTDVVLGGDLTTGEEGVYIRSNGSVSLDLASITAATSSAVRILGGGDSISINASGDISGGTAGIVASSGNAATINIDTEGDIIGTGTQSTGISFQGGDVTITTMGDVTGGDTGITGSSSGNLLFDIGGDISGGNIGIIVGTANGLNLTLREGNTISGGALGIATLSSGSSLAADVLNINGTVNGGISSGSGDDIVTLGTTGTINGTVFLDEGDDTFNLNGGTTGALRGGDGVDTVNFNAGSGTLANNGDDTDAIREFEILNFNGGGYALSGTTTGLDAVNYNAGEHMLFGTLGAAQVTIGTDAILQAADAATINGALTNLGALAINAGGTGAFNISGDFAQGTDGVLALDILSGDDFDQLVVSGNVTLDGTLVLSNTGFANGKLTIIDGGDSLIGSFANVTGLMTGGLLVSQDIEYDRVNNDVNLVLALGVPDGGIAGLNGTQSDLANILVGGFSGGGFNDDLSALALSIGLIGDADDLGVALDELQPEILGSGIQAFRNSQMLFRQTMMNNSGPVFGDATPTQTASLASNADDLPEYRGDGPNVWGSLQYSKYDQDGSTAGLMFDTEGKELAAGVSNIGSGPVTFGFALGYADLETSSNAASVDVVNTDFFRLGGSMRIDIGKLDSGLQARLDTAATAAFGSNELVMNVTIPTAGFAGTQSGKADISSYGISSRFTLEGFGENPWPIQPYVSISYDSVDQDAVNITGAATAIAIESGQFDRFTFGYGATLRQQFGDSTALRLDLSAMHHSNDTQASFSSRFTSTTTPSTLFKSGSVDVKNQYFIGVGIDQYMGSGWSLSLDGFGEFGDIEGYGGFLKLSKRF